MTEEAVTRERQARVSLSAGRRRFRACSQATGRARGGGAKNVMLCGGGAAGERCRAGCCCSTSTWDRAAVSLSNATQAHVQRSVERVEEGEKEKHDDPVLDAVVAAAHLVPNLRLHDQAKESASNMKQTCQSSAIRRHANAVLCASSATRNEVSGAGQPPAAQACGWTSIAKGATTLCRRLRRTSCTPTVQRGCAKAKNNRVAKESASAPGATPSHG